MVPAFASAAEMVAALRPEEPVYCLRPHIVAAAARRFVEAFPGDVLYAVKCNDHRHVLDALYQGGIRHFDTASLAEVAAIHDRFADQTSHYMHPVKSRRSIEQAYYRYGIRSFALDCRDELDKLVATTQGGHDLTLVVRLETSGNQAVCDLSGKFGATVDEAAGLLRAIAAPGRRLGLTFHVGSQCEAPSAYRHAIERAGRVLDRAGVGLDVLDVGGGFPAAYVGVAPPPLEVFLAAIADGVAALSLPPACRLQCEPGRALVAEGCSLVTRVDLRRGDALYLNDGIFGGLSDMTIDGIEFPMRVIRAGRRKGGRRRARPAPFRLFGPTCDSTDKLPGPYWLDGDVGEGDWIEVGQAGAYTNVLSTRFNGFSSARMVTVGDAAFRPSGDVALARPARDAAE
ncbi:MAG: type III PLP-dependent enzyme [Alphaproteobacteria bacterium]